MLGGISEDVADLYVLMHREEGPLATGFSPVDAGLHMARVLRDDPDALPSLWIEPFDVVVAEPSVARREP